jgi:hypothetical protein
MKKLKWMTIPVWVGVSCLLFSACDDDDKKIDEPMPDRFVFGDYYGMCSGDNCIDLYRIEGERVWEDSKNEYPEAKLYSGNYTPRTDINYNDVKSLLEKIPEELFDETETILGEPDAADGGGYYVEIARDNNVRVWLIDKNKIAGREYLDEFKEEMNTKLTLLEANSNQ